MPFGYQCRTRIVKQVPLKPTVRIGPISQELGTPGPNHYEPPEICGGKGFSKIRRAPAYTFGRVLKPCCPPAVLPNAPMFNVSGISEKGGYKIPGGLMTPNTQPPSNKMKVPGPGAHYPVLGVGMKRVPAYSIRPAAKPPYRSLESWTPPPNMYCPPIPKQRAPAYSFRNKYTITTTFKTPGPGQHNPNHDFVKKRKLAFSFGPQYRPYRHFENTPAPNVYCEKKFMLNKPSVPAPSFGIRHSPFLGKMDVALKPSNLELRISQV